MTSNQKGGLQLSFLQTMNHEPHGGGRDAGQENHNNHDGTNNHLTEPMKAEVKTEPGAEGAAPGALVALETLKKDFPEDSLERSIFPKQIPLGRPERLAPQLPQSSSNS